MEKNLSANAGGAGSIPRSGRSPGEGNGNSLQYSCLENPMARGAWRATAHGVRRVRHDLATKPSPFGPNNSWSYEIRCFTERMWHIRGKKKELREIIWGTSPLVGWAEELTKNKKQQPRKWKENQESRKTACKKKRHQYRQISQQDGVRTKTHSQGFRLLMAWLKAV